MLPRAIRVFVERTPNVQVTVSDLRYSEAVASVLHGDVDLGFIGMDHPHPALRFECLVEDDLVLVVPSIHPLAAESSITLRRLAPYPVMLLGQYGSMIEKVSAEFSRYGLQFTPTVTAGNLLTLLGMVDAGNGIALLPQSVVQLNAATPRVFVKITDGDLRRRYGIVVRKDAHLSVVARSFCDFLRSEIRSAQQGEC
jgi:DNA-binding transcriptional LysR family regulator